jgi:hypothetical protein
MRTLIGHEYEVRIEDFDDGFIDGWFHAIFLSPHAREMGWSWEITDPRFARYKLEEVHIIEVRKLTCHAQGEG